MVGAEDLLSVEPFWQWLLKAGGTPDLDPPLCLHMESDGFLTLWLLNIIYTYPQPLTNICQQLF